MVNVDKFLSIANDYRKDNLGDNLIALLPMIIKDNNKLSVIVPFVLDSDRVWDRNESVVPQYFIEIDPKHYEVSKFSLDSISKNSSDGSLNWEISECKVQEKVKYRKYIEEDIKNSSKLSYQEEISKLVNDNKLLSNDYFYSNYEDDINKELDKLVNLISSVKFRSLTNYYDILFVDIVKDYNNDKSINKDKLKLACRLMNNYYQGVDGIDSIFNM